jgi:hypothetical protein
MSTLPKRQLSVLKKWLGPHWSWVSLCNWTIRNDLYTKMQGAVIQMKPEIRTPVGTSFDMPLPFAAWLNPKYYSIEAKGSLRKAAVLTVSENSRRSISVDPVGRYSDNESYDFRPDCEDEFSAGSLVEVYCLHVFHCDNPSGVRDIYVILRQLVEKRELRLHMEDTPEEELLKERSMIRLGYMEVTYTKEEMHQTEEIRQDVRWWWVHRLVLEALSPV